MVIMTNSKNSTTRAFIIGNGKSRQGFDLEQLKPFGTIYGCNALYRDYAPDYNVPDYLVAIDAPITKEITESDFPKDRFIHPIMEEQFEHPEFNPFSRFRSNAGMNAMIEALKHGKRELICLGFDFVMHDEIAMSNMYEGTNAYGPETRTNHADAMRRVKYLDWFANKNNVATFRMVVPRMENLKIHRMEARNIRGMFIDELMGYLQK